MDTVLFILEIIGTLAFAVSGAFVGVRRDMDVFGVVILGLTTAVGGGIIRDLVLGLTPPRTFQHPIYALIAVAASAAVSTLPRRCWPAGMFSFSTSPRTISTLRRCVLLKRRFLSLPAALL